MPHDIFISYSRRDLEAVKPIKEELESLGFSCWMDLEGIESGHENFLSVIVPAIEECRAFLFFISSDSCDSQWTLMEFEHAKANGKRIVPIRFNDISLTRGVVAFKLHIYDIVDWRISAQKAKLLHDLKQWTGQDSGKASSVSPPVPLDFGEALAQHLEKWLPWQKFRCVAGIEFKNGDICLMAHVVGSPWGVFLVGYDARSLCGVLESDFQVLANHLSAFLDMIAERCGLNRHRIHQLFALPEEEFENPFTIFPKWVVSKSGAVEYLNRFQLEIPVLDWEKYHRGITRSIESLPMTHSGRESNVLKHFKAGTVEEIEDGSALLAWAYNPSEQLLDAAEASCRFLFANGDWRTAEGILSWFRVMADRGNVIAMDHYGWLLERNDDERVRWFRKAAELGGAHAQNSLGYCLHEGKGVRQDRNEALRWFRASATQGNRFGQESLARAYAEPDFAGLPQDWNEAFRLYRLSAEQGWHWAQYHLGECFENGLGTQRNLQEARRWYEKAAEQLNAQARSALERLSKE